MGYIIVSLILLIVGLVITVIARQVYVTAILLLLSAERVTMIVLALRNNFFRDRETLVSD